MTISVPSAKLVPTIKVKGKNTNGRKLRIQPPYFSWMERSTALSANSEELLMFAINVGIHIVFLALRQIIVEGSGKSIL